MLNQSWGKALFILSVACGTPIWVSLPSVATELDRSLNAGHPDESFAAEQQSQHDGAGKAELETSAGFSDLNVEASLEPENANFAVNLAETAPLAHSATVDLQTQQSNDSGLPVTDLKLIANTEDATAEQPTASPNLLIADPSVADPLNNESPELMQSNPGEDATADLITPDSMALDSMLQLTSVSELADVQPTDWAYQALQSLVERYGCIVGYPDSTFKGQRALTRYEFAAGLNICLDRISELLASSTADLLSQEDLATRQRLADEFQTELAILRGRVDGLEARVNELDATQFSTTTFLRGNAIFAVADVFGEGDRNQTVFQHRENLSFVTSFTGEDALLLSLYAGNAPLGSLNADPPYTGTFDLAGTEVSATVGGVERSAKASTAEGTLSSQFAAQTNDVLQALTLAYSFPIGNSVDVVFAHALAPFQLYAPTLNPYLSDLESGTGAISVFGEYNPIYALAGGGTGLILNFTPFGESVKLTAGYLADGLAVGDPSPGSGLFNGGYGLLGQLTWKIADNFSIAGVYINEYSPSGRFGFNYNGLGVAGTAVANTLAGQDLLGSRIAGEQIAAIDQSPVITNAYGAQFNWQPSSRFSLSGWFSTFYSRLIGEGDGNILTYALTFAFPDLGKQGNVLGLIVGAEPYLTEMGGDPQDFDVDVPIHVEAFYRHRISDNIFVTPGVIWLLAPNQSNDNPDAVIATLRTTFLF